MVPSAKESAQSLAALAHQQGGYFTSKQAIEAGYGYKPHETAGNFVRVDHGLYRLPTVPTDEHDDLICLSLWSRNRNDEPQAVASHETALGPPPVTWKDEFVGMATEAGISTSDYLSAYELIERF